MSDKRLTDAELQPFLELAAAQFNVVRARRRQERFACRFDKVRAAAERQHVEDFIARAGGAARKPGS